MRMGRGARPIVGAGLRRTLRDLAGHWEATEGLRTKNRYSSNGGLGAKTSSDEVRDSITLFRSFRLPCH